MQRVILGMPGRPVIRHDGFDVFINDSPYAHPWHRCAHGHYTILAQQYGACLILEDDVMLAPDFDVRLKRAVQLHADHVPYLVHLYAGVKYDAFPVDETPFELPPACQDWGTQAIYYSAGARGIAADLTSAYLRARIDRKETVKGLKCGFDCILFPGLRALEVPVYYHAAVQHMQAPSTCLSPAHHSPYFPADVKGIAGWH
jgi:GR25 family glycosyltransferase involved in LPS biosynthesis